jgi:hypothetical protein
MAVGDADMMAWIDFEASSLSTYSYPIEVGWVLEDGTSESHLIRPEPAWTDWASDSALVHGISRADLAAHGVPAAYVAQRLHAALVGRIVYTDAPEADLIWLAVLMRTAGLTPMPLLHVYDSYRSMFRPMVRRLPHSVASGLAQSLVMQAETEVERAGGVRHRAEPDARRLYETWQRVKVLAAAAMEGWPP